MGTNTSTFKLLKRLNKILSKKRRLQLILLIIFMAISSFLEFISVASVFPFVSSISDPGIYKEIVILKEITNFFRIENQINLTIFFAIILCVLSILSSVLKTISLWLNARMSGLISSDLSIKAYRSLLNTPLLYFTKIDSSSLIVKIENTGLVAGGILQPFFTLINALIIAIVISLGLFLTSPKVFISSSLLILLVSTITNSLSRNKVKLLGFKIVETNSERIQSVQNALGSFRDIKVNFLERYFSKRYNFLEREVRRIWSNTIAITSLPTYILESTGIIILCLTSIILTSTLDFKKAIPILALILLSIQKLLPYIKQILSSIVIIRNNNKALLDLLELSDLKGENTIDQTRLFSNLLKKIEYKNLSLKNISFKYPGSKKFLFKNFSYIFKPGDFITITGSSGSGKTTLIDIILGLIPSNNGNISLNGITLNTNDNVSLSNYRGHFSHVPQNVFILNSSILENICLGENESSIDYDKLNKCLEICCLKDTIRKLNHGINTNVGENGSLISGGQRQRIGIARALYRNFNILVLDESTSAIDEKTQSLIIKNLINNYQDKTIIHITHRISSIPNHSKIINL